MTPVSKGVADGEDLTQSVRRSDQKWDEAVLVGCQVGTPHPCLVEWKQIFSREAPDAHPDAPTVRVCRSG